MWKTNGFMISTDKALLNLDIIHHFIAVESYWGKGRTREAMEKAILNSAYCFGVYQESHGKAKQIGFARVVSDLTTFGYLADVFIVSDHRGKGLGKWLVRTIVNHPELKTLRRIALFTDTPDFYADLFATYDQTTQKKFMVHDMF